MISDSSLHQVQLCGWMIRLKLLDDLIHDEFFQAIILSQFGFSEPARPTCQLLTTHFCREYSKLGSKISLKGGNFTLMPNMADANLLFDRLLYFSQNGRLPVLTFVAFCKSMGFRARLILSPAVFDNAKNIKFPGDLQDYERLVIDYPTKLLYRLSDEDEILEYDDGSRIWAEVFDVRQQTWCFQNFQFWRILKFGIADLSRACLERDPFSWRYTGGSMHFLMGLEHGKPLMDLAARYIPLKKVKKLRGARLNLWIGQQLVADESIKINPENSNNNSSFNKNLPPAARMARRASSASFQNSENMTHISAKNQNNNYEKPWKNNAAHENLSRKPSFKTVKITSLNGSYLHIPEKRGDYKHSEFILQSMVKSATSIFLEKKPVAIVKGERLYFRSQIAELKTVSQWKKEGRAVKPDANPVKQLSDKQKSDLFQFSQTVLAPQRKVSPKKSSSYKRRKVGDGEPLALPASSESASSGMLALPDKRRRTDAAADNKWLATWQALKEFVEKNDGNFPRQVRQCADEEEKKLSKWVSLMHKNFTNVALIHWKLDKLEEIPNWSWPGESSGDGSEAPTDESSIEQGKKWTESILEEIQNEFLNNEFSISERKMVIRGYQRLYHPDKNPGREDLVRPIFEYAQVLWKDTKTLAAKAVFDVSSSSPSPSPHPHS